MSAVQAALEASVLSGRLGKQFETYVLPDRTVKLTAKDNQALKVLLARTRETLAPPQSDELLPELPVDKKRLSQLVAMLVEDGELAVAPGAVYFDPAALATAREKLQAALRQQGGGGAVTVSEANSIVGTSRKYGLPLLHLFENEGWLVRDGDLRRLRP
jgi:hypothetical protein